MNNLLYGALAVIAITVGPFLLLLRGVNASSLEKVVYATSVFPLGFIIFTFRYFITRTKLMAEPDTPTRRERLEQLKMEYRQFLFIFIPAALIAAVGYLWLVFVRFPAQG